MSAPTYRRDIDGLRAIAVVAVVAFHAFPQWLPGGFVGVDIFFVISGFLITRIIVQQMEGGTFSFADFYARRARRIFPALGLVLLSSLVAGWIILLPDEYASLGKHAAASSVFVANFALLAESGYFDVSSQFKPLLHLWSLGIEEQFYLVWPGLLALASVVAVRKWWVLIAVLAASLAVSFWLTGLNTAQAFYLPQSRVWELAAGATLAVLGQRADLPKMAREALSLVGLTLVAASVLIVREGVYFPAPGALLPVAGAVCLIAAGPLATANRFLLGNRIAVAIGLISYPLYLWHWPLLSFPAILLGGDTPREWRIAGVAAAIVLAAATYLLIERPIRKVRVRPAAIFSTLALLLPAAMGAVAFWNGGFPQREHIQATAAASADFAGPIWEYTSNEQCLADYSVPGQENYGWWFCVKSDAGPTDVLIVGNSYANQYYPGFANNEAFSGDTVLSIGTCGPGYIELEDVVQVASAEGPCSYQRRYDQQQLLADISANERPRLVVIAGFASPETSTTEVDAGINKQVGLFLADGANVVVILPHLASAQSIRGCFGRPALTLKLSCEIPAETVQTHKQRIQSLGDGIRAVHPEVAIFDPNGIYCADETCSFVIEGRPVFRDEYNHLTEFASERVISNLVSFLELEYPEFLP